MTGHRYFDNTCEHISHHPGDRHFNVGTHDLEWTGTVWAPVCAADDVMMVDRDSESRLCCGVCGLRASDTPVRLEAPVRS